MILARKTSRGVRETLTRVAGAWPIDSMTGKHCAIDVVDGPCEPEASPATFNAVGTVGVGAEFRGRRVNSAMRRWRRLVRPPSVGFGRPEAAGLGIDVGGTRTLGISFGQVDLGVGVDNQEVLEHDA